MTRTGWIAGIAMSIAMATSLHAQNLTGAATAAPDTVPAATTPAVVATAPDSSAAVTTAAGPVQSLGPVAVRRAEAPAPLVVPSMLPRSTGMGQNVAMMVVGGAALITGAVVGGTPGTVIMVGGAVIGLVGLYHYLQ